MNAKRMIKWAIVLFLLSALPALTVALAQGGEPTGPQAPATWNVYESEPNDSHATADPIALGDVVGGELEYYDFYEICGSDDFRFSLPTDGFILIDISHYRWIQVEIDQEGETTLAAQEFQSTGNAYEHHLMFYSLPAGNYYIDLWDDHCGDGDHYPYEMTVSSPLLLSAAAANLGTGTVAGIPFKAGDILAHSDLNNEEARRRMFFDASDVGLTKNVTNISAGDGDEMLLSLAANQSVPGAGTVTPWDTIVFDPVSYGNTTAGSFRMSFGAFHQALTLPKPKLDAIATSRYCDYLSTTGTATVPFYMGYNIKFKDEDLGCWYQDTEWLWGFESRFVTGLPVEDVYAAAYNVDADEMYLTILGNGKVFGHKVTQKDIFAINYGDYSWGGYVWRGPDHGWNYNIDAFDYTGW